MKNSVVIIAHNEEKYIEKCIKSILDQTKKPDEVILVAHNCTDSTIDLVQKYPIEIIIFNESPGIVYARIKGVSSATGNNIFCIDGDSYAENNWIEVLSEKLKSNVLAGSYVKIRGSFISNINNIFNKYLCSSKNFKAIPWLWGTSFAFSETSKAKILNILEKSVELSKKINLTRNPDDYWVANYMGGIGNIEVTNKTFVTQNPKEKGWLKEILRNIENATNGTKIKIYLKKN